MPTKPAIADRHDRGARGRTRVRLRAVTGAVTGGVIATGLWVAMGLAFPSLVFHLQPALIGTAAGFTARWAIDDRARIPEVASMVAASAGAIVVGFLALSLADRTTDPVPFVIVTWASGCVIGAWLMRRRTPVEVEHRSRE